MTYFEGQQISYNNMTGMVNFICDDYITMTVSKGKHKAQDCNLLIYRKEWNKVYIEDGK